MVIENLKIVLINKIIKKGYLVIEDEKIVEVGEGEYKGSEYSVDGEGKIAMPGFIDVHVHGSAGLEFMTEKVNELKIIAQSLYEEGVTTFLATTLTAPKKALLGVCKAVKEAKEQIPSLYGIHFEGPYISLKYKGAQNPEYIRDPDIEEFDELQKASGGNVKYITIAVEKNNALPFIKHITEQGVVASVGHSDATFEDVEKAIDVGLTNVTHTHNAQSPHHHRNPGIVTAAFYFDSLYTECICDKIHVCPNALKTMHKIVGPNRFIAITDALKVKHTSAKDFDMFGLPAEQRDGAAYLKSGPLAGSTLTMDQALRNLHEITGASLINLAKATSTNAAHSLRLTDRGEIKPGLLADLVLLNKDLYITDVYKLGKKVI